MQVKYMNRLISEKSPYLLQHAHNPVDWYPWGEEAFRKAKEEDKPIFLSIGYSTCHWCHVMERESFEDEEVAEILNKYFVPIKVDREERPDIDTIYMAVCQAMTGHGGWPLTVILTPEKKPFFAGTYFPKHSSRGMPGLTDILAQVANLWDKDKDKLISSGNQISEAVKTMLSTHDSGDIAVDALHKAYSYFESAFDEKFGGFGRAPKFPTPHNLSLLLYYWKLTGNEKALQMVEKTLDSMYAGGIYDHIGYGFARYSTDRKWLVPHFEKMLYDNALLAIAYLQCYQATKKEKYAQIAEEIFTYVLRDMTSPEGGFYSAEDADSEGEEGKFYVWTPEEINKVLGKADGEKFCEAYDITPEGNFEGKNIPNLINPKRGTKELNLNSAKQKLFRERENRIHPFKDDKILTSWNGLMIAALAIGARTLDKKKYAHSAEKALNFIFTNLVRKDGRLMARYRDGESAHIGYVEDYAFLIWGLLEMYHATFNQSHLEKALSFIKDMIKLFWDDENGGLFQYGSDSENLITRPKEIYDGAIPSGNSVAAVDLIRLAHLTEDIKLKELAEKQIRAFGGTVNKTPYGHTHFLLAVYLYYSAPIDVKIKGNLHDEVTNKMIKAVKNIFSPEIYLTLEPQSNKAEAYVCKNYSCFEPVTDPVELTKLIQ